MKKNPKTCLTKRGYTIIKKYFSNEDINKLKKDLTVKPYVNEDYGARPKPFPIFLESNKKIYLPKHYGFKTFGEPESFKINKGKNIDIKFKGSLRNKQIPIVNSYLETCKEGKYTQFSRGGIISVPCGWGKTIMALYLISFLKKKTIVIVHKEFLLNQWKKRINDFLPDARIGIIQGPKIDIVNKDIVLAMLQSISMKDYNIKSTFGDFGFTIIDECHHIAAEVFSKSLPKINSYYSLGLSATPKRNDGLSPVFHSYLGPTVYTINKRDDRKVDVRVINFYDLKNKDYNKEEITAFGKMCVPKMITNIANNINRNILIICLVKSLIKNGNQILILSDRRSHLKLLYSLIENFTTVGYYVGGMKQKDLDISESKNVILGTYPMSSEGLDIPSLDSIIFTTPKSSIEQSIGRITRKQHKNMPIAYDIVDNFSMFSRQYLKRERIYKRLNYNISEIRIDVFNNTDEEKFNSQLALGFDKVNYKNRNKSKNKKNECLIIDE